MCLPKREFRFFAVAVRRDGGSSDSAACVYFFGSRMILRGAKCICVTRRRKTPNALEAMGAPFLQHR